VLLFLTNILSILLAGGGVFTLLGLSAVSVKRLEPSPRRSAFGVVALGITTMRIYQQKLIKREIIQLAEQWVAGRAYGIREVEVSGNQVTLAIYGSGDRPELSELGDQLTASLDQPVDVNLVIVPSEQEIYVAEGE